MNSNKQENVMIGVMQIIVLWLAMVATPALQAMNLLRPYDILIRPEYSLPKEDAKLWWQAFIILEGGIADRGFNHDAHHVPATKIWECTQDSLAMLAGFPSDSPIGKKESAVDADDDGTRGHFDVRGKLDTQFAGAIALRSFFHQSFSLNAYLPFYVQRLRDVSWCDLTQDITDEDARVKQLLTNNIFSNVCELGDLDINGWKRSGVGDLTLQVEWFQDFKQAKPLLRNVRVYWRAGVGLPTGLPQDENKILALPFGADKAFSIPFGFGLDLTFVFHMRVGLNVDLMHTFGNTRCRRIQTAQDQTGLLLLQKVDAYKDFGLTQYFSLYAQVYKLFAGESLMLGYEFTKHGSDELAFNSDIFSATIANMATYLQDWTMHQIILRGDYDFGTHMDDDAWVTPRLSLYARCPFNGKRIAANTMVGATFALDF
jgi:hypothetical protein